MSISSVQKTSDSRASISGADFLPRQTTFHTCDLDHARAYITGVLAEHRLAYLPRERHLDFHHRQAKLGPVGVNLMEYGAGIMVDAPPFTDFYLLQFTLSGWCQIWQNKTSAVFPAGSVAIVDPFPGFKKAWMPGTRQLFLRIDKRLVQREFRAWTGVDEAGEIEFQLSPINDMAKVGTLTRYVQMLCDDLRDEKSDLVHPLVCDRIASG